ncbi:MAG: hypothetical protein ACI9J2_001920 [Saprospiraceae bacterium]|jgi:hypothetical protein
MKNLLNLSFIVAGLLAFSTSNVLARTYIVEMIVFTNEGTSAERWDFTSKQTVTRRNKISEIYARSKSLNSGEGLSYLAGVFSTLARSTEHRILKTGRWTQESANYQSSPLVKIEHADRSIEGAVRVYAPNLLFAEINLMYAPNGDSLSVTTTASGESTYVEEVYFIDERRRMKLKETHYFDHSKFGVLLTVVPQ